MAQIRCSIFGHSFRFRGKSVSSLAILSLQARTVRVNHLFSYLGRVFKAIFLTITSAIRASPNPAHYAISRLAISRIRHKISPNSQFTHITQNIDGLYTRALEETTKELNETDVSPLIEMHGHIFDVVCTAHDCDFHERNHDSPICPALKGTELILEAGGPDPIVRRSDLPRCPKCGQLCRPGVVWFGERPHHIEKILQLADEADLCIIVGTSAVVRSAVLSYSRD